MSDLTTKAGVAGRLRVLVGFETSGRTRRAFEALGHDAWSCDLLDAQDATNRHIVGDVFDFLDDGWDLAIFHPTCTFLTGAAEWAYGDGPYHQKVKPGTLVGAERRAAREKAIEDFVRLDRSKIPRTAIENPVGCISTRYRRPDQIVQPYQFGDDASKKTCLWLKGLPPLPIDPAKRKAGRMVEWPRGSGAMVERWANQTDSNQNRMPPSDDRWARRSDTYPGIAQAFAETWRRAPIVAPDLFGEAA